MSAGEKRGEGKEYGNTRKKKRARIEGKGIDEIGREKGLEIEKKQGREKGRKRKDKGNRTRKE